MVNLCPSIRLDKFRFNLCLPLMALQKWMNKDNTLSQLYSDRQKSDKLLELFEFPDINPRWDKLVTLVTQDFLAPVSTPKSWREHPFYLTERMIAIVQTDITAHNLYGSHHNVLGCSREGLHPQSILSRSRSNIMNIHRSEEPWELYNVEIQREKYTAVQPFI